MKKGFSQVALFVLSIIIAGCASAPTTFNAKYFSSVDPEKPIRRIDFSPAQNQTIDDYLHETKTLNDASLFWLGDKRLYLNLEGADILFIDTAAETITVASPEESAQVAEVLSNKVVVVNAVNQKGVFSKLVKSVFSYSGQHYTGQISFDGRPPLKVDIETQQELSEGTPRTTVCTNAQLAGEITDGDGNILPIQWECPCEWMPKDIADIKVPQQLRKIQIAPSARRIAFEGLLYDMDAGGKVETLYSSNSSIISSTINPDWTMIALLRGKGGKYWIDLFELTIERPVMQVYHTPRGGDKRSRS